MGEKNGFHVFDNLNSSNIFMGSLGSLSPGFEDSLNIPPGNQNTFFYDLGLAQDLYRLSLAHKTNGHFIHSPHGISSAMYPLQVRRQDLLGENQRPCGMFLHREEMQNPYMMNTPVLEDYIYGFGYSDSEHLGVREPLRYSGSGLGNHQALMIPDDSIVLEGAGKRMGRLVISGDVGSRVEHEGSDGACGLGSISFFAKTQLGCRFLQRMLSERKYEDVQLIFNDVIHYVPELSVDPYGNYLVQKLLDVCNEEQITQLVRVITRNPVERIRICKNSHGTRVVQKIIQKVKNRQQIALILKALEAGFLDLVTDVNGNHVLQQCLHCFTEEHNKFIFDGAATFCTTIATHRYGCCVLNQCIAHSSKRYREKLVTKICANGLLLAQDSFGNYVIQNILELKIPSAATALLAALKGHFVLLSMQKCGSHVVEKCLRCCEQSRPIIIHELLSASRFDQLLQHPFANYVIQSALQVTKGPVRTLLVKALLPYKTLNTNPYCKKIFSTNLLKK